MAGSAGAADGPPVIEIRGLAKAYGATVALSGVSFAVRHGEIHALLGENGAGKSTLVKILSGIVAADSGSALLDGKPFLPHSLMEARAAGVSTAFQELSLLPNLSVATNLALPHLLKGPAGLTSVRRNQARAAEILAEFGVTDIAPAAIVGDLSLAQKQRIELVRALSRRPRLLILDEPTASLAEPEWLFIQIERLVEAGLGVLYISHRLAEVRRLCARGTVLRNGESAGTVELAGTKDAEIFRMMVGFAPEGQGRDRARSVTQACAARLALCGVSDKSLRNVSLDIGEGEIVGVAALEGQGQRALFRILAGAAQPTSGHLEVDGRPVRLRSPAQALHAGIGFVPEERKTEGIFLGLSTGSNVSLPILSRLHRFGLIGLRREHEAVREVATTVDLAERYLGMDVAALSGGNQQKALLGRVLRSGARKLVLFDPTRGVDVGTKQVIYGVIRAFVRRGGSVLMYSTELSELVQLVDRCVVLYEGEIIGEVSGGDLTEDRLVTLAAGNVDRVAA
ncbi:MAG: sugar ABC transporter ATP-binding protein [Acetobacteraceae bacterium]